MACVRRAGSARLRHPGSREAISRSGAASQRPHHACAVPLASIGALIGVTARTPETGGALSLIVTAVLVSLGPVVAPARALAHPRLDQPGDLRGLGRPSNLARSCDGPAGARSCRIAHPLHPDVEACQPSVRWTPTVTARENPRNGQRSASYSRWMTNGRIFEVGGVRTAILGESDVRESRQERDNGSSRGARSAARAGTPGRDRGRRGRGATAVKRRRTTPCQEPLRVPGSGRPAPA